MTNTERAFKMYNELNRIPTQSEWVIDGGKAGSYAIAKAVLEGYEQGAATIAPIPNPESVSRIQELESEIAALKEKLAEAQSTVQNYSIELLQLRKQIRANKMIG